MNMVEIGLIVQIFQQIVLTIAIIFGGIWALFRFRLLREYEGNIELEVSTNCTPCENGNSIVFINTTIKNTGTRTVIATPKKYLNGKLVPIYTNNNIPIYHSFVLQIKRMDTSIQGSIAYDWYGSSNFTQDDNLPDEIDLLLESNIPPNIGDFWLNSGDTCHLGTVVKLPSGHYLAKVSFVGTHGTADYTSRILYFHVA